VRLAGIPIFAVASTHVLASKHAVTRKDRDANAGEVGHLALVAGLLVHDALDVDRFE
jgi:bisphosphoglycerate-independent phosphoglycerate mutase (AlkP superfamily)